MRRVYLPHSNETLLSAGLVSAPCSVDLQQYACSSVRRPRAENSVHMSWCWWLSGNLRPSKCAAVSGISIIFPERRCPLMKSVVFVAHGLHCWKPGWTPEVSTIQQQQLLQGDLETAFHQSKWCSGQSPRHLLQHSWKYGKYILNNSPLVFTGRLTGTLTVIIPHYIISLSQSEVMSCPKCWMWLESWDWTASVLTNGETSLSSACCWVNIWSRFYRLHHHPFYSALAAKTWAAKLTSTCKRSISSTIAQDCQELLRCLFNFILDHFSVCQRLHLSMRLKEETWWTSSSCPSSEETQQVRWRFTDVSCAGSGVHEGDFTVCVVCVRCGLCVVC